MSSPFDEAEAWSSTGGIGPGNHKLKISAATGSKTKKSGFTQVELELENEGGARILDWVIYKPDFLSKIVGVFDAADIARPQQGEFDPATFELTDACVARLAGKWVGGIVRSEPDYKDPAKLRSRIQSYVKVADLGKQPDPEPVQTTSGGGGGYVPPSDEDDIPFAFDPPYLEGV